jgi:nucleotide-binding universal stress UspA family protein
MYKRMLVPLDGSEMAEVALPYSEELAEKLDSEVILINVRAPGEDPDNPEHRLYLSKMAATIEQNIRKSSDIPPGRKIKVESSIIGSSGLLTHAAEEIVDYAEKENISLIVMATHGRTGIKRWALGSTTDKVVRASESPVLLIRANTGVRKKTSLDKILVPLDGSKHSETILSHIESLASRLRARVILLHVVIQPYRVYAASEGVVEVPYTEEEIKSLKADAEEYLQKVSSKLMAERITTSYEVRVGSAAEEIIKLADETPTDVVAMSTHGESGFSRWEHGSIADKVLHAGNTPLLLVRPQHR